MVEIGRRGMGAGGGEKAMKTRGWRGWVEIGGGVDMERGKGSG